VSEETWTAFQQREPQELQLAKKEAIAQKPLLCAYLNAEVRGQLVSGDVLAAQLWSTTAQLALGTVA
jgi:spermidine/putrescine transport system substrate-binding protein